MVVAFGGFDVFGGVDAVAAAFGFGGSATVSLGDVAVDRRPVGVRDRSVRARQASMS